MQSQLLDTNTKLIDAKLFNVLTKTLFLKFWHHTCTLIIDIHFFYTQGWNWHLSISTWAVLHITKNSSYPYSVVRFLNNLTTAMHNKIQIETTIKTQHNYLPFITIISQYSPSVYQIIIIFERSPISSNFSSFPNNIFQAQQHMSHTVVWDNLVIKVLLFLPLL